MLVWSESITAGGAVPESNAFGTHDPETHVALCANRSPHIAWSEVPAAAKSLALVMHDPDVPSAGDDVNQEGKTVPADLPRVDFYHWLLTDLAPDASPLAEGEFGDGVTARGKEGPGAPRGARHGVNDYTGWFAGDADMSGSYYGYDGPCPPWNDSIVHHYHFTLYALDVASLELADDAGGAAVLAAMEGHVIDKASFMATYTINPDAVDALA